MIYRSLIGSLKEHKTRLIGGVKIITINPKKRRNVMLAGVVGLTMSLFLTFFLVYLGNAREKEKEKEEE